MLIEEIERLHVDAWNAKAAGADGPSEHERKHDVDPSLELDKPEELALTLRGRLGRLRRHA